MFITLKELKWLKQRFASFDLSHLTPMRLFHDSKLAIHIATNTVFHKHTKHLEKKLLSCT